MAGTITAENNTAKDYPMRFTPTGLIAKIDGIWYSVNGNENEIVEVRYPLTEKELKEYKVSND